LKRVKYTFAGYAQWKKGEDIRPLGKIGDLGGRRVKYEISAFPAPIERDIAGLNSRVSRE
jgi:hypothetical protein